MVTRAAGVRHTGVALGVGSQAGSGGTGLVADDLTGTTIGPYEVLARLATGGMAELLLAKRTGIEGFRKVVVLKRILPHFANQPDFVEMFLHEARLAATLEHENVVPVFDIGKAGDDYYFAMAYAHGRDVLAILRELSRRSQRMAFVHAIAISAGVAAGLHHAHERVGFDGEPLGIVHRDVSPANAIVTFDGGVKLVDFGIAKAAAQTNVTRVGVRKGKAAYMSPEQCRGDAIDRRSDIWSLGIVLYEMLAMTRAFRADSELAIMHRIVSHDVAPPSRLQPDIPPDLEAIVMRCLQRDPAERYQTALDLQRELESFAAAHNLQPGAGLGEFLVTLFGNVPFPWSSSPSASTSSAALRSPSSAPRPADVVVREGGLSAMPPVFATTMPPDAPTSPVGPQLESVVAPGGSRIVHTIPTPVVDPRLALAPELEPRTASFDERSRREPVTDVTTPRRTTAIAVTLLLAVGIVGVVGWVAAGSDGATPHELESPPPAANVLTTADPVAPPPAAVAQPAPPPPPSAADLEAWLAAVHQTDPARALDWATRHALLERLEASSASARIDRRVQLALDLREVADAPRPCTALAQTLDAIAAADDPWFADALAQASVPDPATAPHAGAAPDRSCEGLEARLVELRAKASPVEPGTDVAVAEPKTKRPRTGEPKPTPVPTPASTMRRPPPKAPDPPRAPDPRRLDEDELRPFRKSSG